MYQDPVSPRSHMTGRVHTGTMRRRRGGEKEGRRRSLGSNKHQFMVHTWLVSRLCTYRLYRLVVPLATVCCECIEVKVPTTHTIGIRLHLSKQRAVERVVISVGQEVIVPGQRCIAFELVVAIQTWLITKQWQRCSARGSIASYTQLCSHGVPVCYDTEHGEQYGKVVTYVVHVLLGVDEFGEVGDAVVGEEVVVCGGIKTWTRAADVIGSWFGILVGGISVCWYLSCN
jgi:hypothetical protein